MNNIQKQIDKSVEEFDKGFEKLIRLRFTSYDFSRMKDRYKQSQLDLIEVIKGEIEKLHYSETIDVNDFPSVRRRDVLDLLNNLK